MISNVEEIGGRWFWTHTDDMGETTRMRTNLNYTGCFVKDGKREEWKQIYGTSQFSLNGKSKSAIRAYLRRMFD